MPLPAALKNRLSIPVIGAPLFIISNPDLVIAQCKAGIVGSFPSLNARTGVHGNYLKSSIVASGLDPENLPQSDPSKMNFGSGGNTKAKAWKNIWGSGQGIGAMKEVISAGDYIARLRREYDDALDEMRALKSV